MSKSFKRRQREQVAKEWPLGKKVEALIENEMGNPVPLQQLKQSIRKSEQDHPQPTREL